MQLRIIAGLSVLMTVAILFAATRTSAPNRPTDFRDAPNGDCRTVGGLEVCNDPNGSAPAVPVPTSYGSDQSAAACITNPKKPCPSISRIRADVSLVLKHKDCEFGGRLGPWSPMNTIQHCVCSYIDQTETLIPSGRDSKCDKIHKETPCSKMNIPAKISLGALGSMDKSNENCKKPGGENAWFYNHFNFHVISSEYGGEGDNGDGMTLIFKKSHGLGAGVLYDSDRDYVRGYTYHFQLECKWDAEWKAWKAHKIIVQENQSQASDSQVSASASANPGGVGGSFTAMSGQSTSYTAQTWNEVVIDHWKLPCGEAPDAVTATSGAN
jgi:hypothetical protein